MKYFYSWATPLGVVHAECNDEGLTSLMINDNHPQKEFHFIHPLLMQAKKELEEYFQRKRTNFTVETDPKGTDFQKKVWKALKEIPYGKRWSYQDIAEKILHKNAVRAVGSACRANPILIIIPCHRVIKKSGKIGNFSAGIHIKNFLLSLEDLSN